jgi:hypothetical protein
MEAGSGTGCFWLLMALSVDGFVCKTWCTYTLTLSPEHCHVNYLIITKQVTTQITQQAVEYLA